MLCVSDSDMSQTSNLNCSDILSISKEFDPKYFMRDIEG